MVATLLLAAMAAPKLLISKLEGLVVQLVVVSPGGAERVIHTHPLAFRMGERVVDGGRVGYRTSEEDQTHDGSLVRSAAFALDRRRRRIACLNVVDSRFRPGAEGSGLFEGWTQEVDLFTLDYSGRLVAKARVEFPGADTSFLGLGADGKAMLVRLREREPRGFEVWSSGRWRSKKTEDLPPSFRARLQPRDPSFEARFVARRGGKPSLDLVAWSPEWTGIDLLRFSPMGDPARLTVDPTRKASLLLDPGPLFGPDRWIDARWGRRSVSWRIGKTGVVPMHLYPLDFPKVVGRDLRGESRLPLFKDHPLSDEDPFLDSRIVIFDLRAHEVRPVCRGILAMPM